jgi:SAM-dependent methyltransferase
MTPSFDIVAASAMGEGPDAVRRDEQPPPDKYGYSPAILPSMIATSARQRAKDQIFVETLATTFVPGRVLEIGAGCGQLSELLQARGRPVTPSDIAPFLVEYMSSRGLKPITVDALDITAGIDRPYENVFAQGLSTLITRDEPTIAQTYRSVHQALTPGGRFVFILPAGWRERWSDANVHLRLGQAAGLRVVRRFRHQALPSRLYSRLPRPVLRLIDATVGRVLGARWVFVFARDGG